MVMARHPAPDVLKCMSVAVLSLLLGWSYEFGQSPDQYGTQAYVHTSMLAYVSWWTPLAGGGGRT